MHRLEHSALKIPNRLLARGLLAAAVGLLAGGTAWGEAGAEVIQTFEVAEHFGVSHPSQVIDFDLKEKVDPAGVHVVDEKGQPVAFQVLEGGKKVAVQTALAAGTSRRWQLVRGAAQLPPAALEITKVKDGDRTVYQISNGITGVRLPLPIAAPSAAYKPLVELFNYGPDSPRLFLPAPVQGVLLRDGTWTARDRQGLVMLANRLVKMDVRFLEKGPLEVVAEVSYEVVHPEYRYGLQRLRPAGKGYYRSTLTLQAGQPSILFEEETNLEMTWSLNLYAGLRPTTARYRGHSSQDRKYGYTPDGQALPPAHARRPLDAQVDLRYDRPMTSAYVSTDTSWRQMAVWDPWASNTGWYWQMFDARGGDSANLVGIFAGRASRALGAGHSGAGVFTLPARTDGADPAAGITVSSYRRSPSGQVFPLSRFQWGLFVGTGEDLKKPDAVQPINLQMNLHGGFSLNKVHRYSLDFPDPPGGYGGLYMDRKAVEALKRRLRADPQGIHGRGYLAYLYNADPYSRPLIDMWIDRKGDRVRTAVREVRKTATDMLDAFVNGAGIYAPAWHFWHGGTAMMRHGVWIDQILADPRTTPQERRQIKAAAVLFANVLWDDDFVPLFDGHGVNLGTANMPVQQMGYRHFYALLLAQHPTMAARARAVEAEVRQTVRGLINESGAEIGCPHYIGASFVPTLNTLLQVKKRSPEDPFKAEPRLGRFADFYLNLLTPPEPRVGKKRALIALGDGSTEPSETFGVLGTGFRDADPRLSARLLGAWNANGKPHSSFFGTTTLMIDDSLPRADPKLGDATFPGYYSVLRHGWGTPQETALWLVNGDHYSDHRHNDHGTLVLYALGKPLSLHWEGLYTPQAPGAYLHSGVVLERDIGHAWDQDGASLTAGGHWGHSTQEAFATFEEGACARAHFQSGKTTWTRSVLALRADPRHPIVVIRDTFAGDGARQPKVLTFNLMARGPVETPAGKISPPLRRYPAQEYRPGTGELPSAGSPFDLLAGVNRLGFTGQLDVDWDVYTLSDQAQTALIGNWAVTPWGTHMTVKEQRQHILRVRGSGPFTTVILPWRRGDRPADLSVTASDNAVIVKSGTVEARIEPAEYSVKSGGRTVTRQLPGRDR